MTRFQPLQNQNQRQMKKVQGFTFQLLSQVRKIRTPISNSSRFRPYCLVKTQLLWTPRQFNLKTMNQQKQVKRNVELLSRMQLTPTKVSSETIMKIGFPSFWIFSSQRIRPTSILSGLKFASSECLMDMEARHVLTTSEITCITLWYRMNSSLRTQSRLSRKDSMSVRGISLALLSRHRQEPSTSWQGRMLAQRGQDLVRTWSW